MLIESVHIRNFRSILDESLTLEDLTALVGPNGAGKSSFIKALDIFHSFSPNITEDDFYNKETNKGIFIAVTYYDLSSEAKEKFQKYLQYEKLTVALIIAWTGTKANFAYHGYLLKNTDFQSIRNALEIKDRLATAREKYNQLIQNELYSALPPSFRSNDQLSEILATWEEENPEKCTRSIDDGHFFGYKEVGQKYIEQFVKFLFIPAVRDASDDSNEAKGAVITQLMDLVVRSVISQKPEVIEFKEKIQLEYAKVFDPVNFNELSNLSGNLSLTLQTYIPGSEVILDWRELPELNTPLPQADVRLNEDGFKAGVEKTGHGLQRAFILSLLQTLVHEQIKSGVIEDDDFKGLPDLIIAIEEPELYQHPNRQRHLATILYQLAKGDVPGVAEKTQVIYATHSPYFVGLDRFEKIRVIRKRKVSDEQPKISVISKTTLDEVAEKLWENEGKTGVKFTRETLLPRLKSTMTPQMNEGFFSDLVVLVEGEDDRAAIIGASTAKKFELEGNGISVIPCRGKTNLDKPYVIFTSLEIPSYLIWDSDSDKKETKGKCETCGKALDNKSDPKENIKLLRIAGAEETDWPECVHTDFSCFKCNLEEQLIQDIGDDLYLSILTKLQGKYGIPKIKHAKKNPYLISELIVEAKKHGIDKLCIESIIEQIIEKRNSAQ